MQALIKSLSMEPRFQITPASSASGDLSYLADLFQQINHRHFEGELTLPELHWNKRLRSSAGRFIPGRKRIWGTEPATIEIASYLLEEKNALHHVADTLAHEMIHYWLWFKKRPYGHTSEFWKKMRQMGVSRYNPVPRRRPFKYLYLCPSCDQEYPARKKVTTLACARCCRKHNDGYFHKRFQLVLHKLITPAAEPISE